MDKNSLFMDCKGTIYKAVKMYSEKYGMDFEEVESEALYTFCECLQKFDETRGIKFNTFLTSELRRVNNYCRKETEKRMKYEVLEEAIQPYLQPEFTRVEFEDSLNTELSAIARQVVEGIMSGELLSQKGYKPFTIDKIMEKFKMDFYSAQAVFFEIKNWWNVNWEGGMV